MRVLAPYVYAAADVPGAPLTTYLRAQQLAACANKSPGASTQRTYVNGDGSGGFNTGMFLKQASPGFDAFDVDAFLIVPPAACAGKVYISEHHYLSPCGLVHNGGLVDTDTMKVIGRDSLLYYDETPYTGTIVKLLPYNAEFYLEPTDAGLSRQIPCFTRARNTMVSGEYFWTQPVNAFNINEAYTAVGYQFTPDHPLYAWQQQESDYYMSWGNDSGSPVFCGIYGEAVLVSFTAAASAVGWDKFHLLLDTITIKMQELATYYSDPNALEYRPQTVALNRYFGI